MLPLLQYWSSGSTFERERNGMAQGSDGIPDNVRAFLNERHFASLATANPDGSLQQTVMWYLLDGDDIVMNTAIGRVKYRNLENDAQLSVCVEDEYRYVSVAGPASVDTDQTRAHADILRLAKRYEGEEGGQGYYDRSFLGAQRATIRLAVDRVVHNGFE